jgi:hypothetical protein
MRYSYSAMRRSTISLALQWAIKTHCIFFFIEMLYVFFYLDVCFRIFSVAPRGTVVQERWNGGDLMARRRDCD